MNLDKQLAKYAKNLNNPKYYDRILKVLDKADKKNYEFKMFNAPDMCKITGEILAYYDYVGDDVEKDKQIIRYFNNDWFIVSDKNYVLAKTHSIWIALNLFISTNLMIRFAKLKQLFRPDIYIDIQNARNDVYIFKGALKAAEFLNTDVFELDKFEA